MTTRTASRNASHPRAAYPDTASEYAALPAFSVIRRAGSPHPSPWLPDRFRRPGVRGHRNSEDRSAQGSHIRIGTVHRPALTQPRIRRHQ
jgi:hypothetical protein